MKPNSCTRTRSRLLVVALVSVTAFVGSACGRDSRPNAGGRSGVSSTSVEGHDEIGAESTTTVASGRASGNAESGSDPTGSGSGAEGGSASVEAPAQTGSESNPLTIEITAEVDRECVKPGDVQTITFRTIPRGHILYDTVYPDGVTGISDSHYGGSNTGQADEAGAWDDSFTVEVGAPPGEAHVNVGVFTPKGEKGFTRVVFRIARLTGRCE